MSDRPTVTVHSYTKPVDTMPPKVAVVIVTHREQTDAMLLEALESLTIQSYPHIECVIVDNSKTNRPIGEARNAGVQATDAPLVTFLAEEDMFTLDTIGAMVAMWQMCQKEFPGTVHVTVGAIMQLENGARALTNQVRAPGLFTREFLLSDPFDTARDRPDVAMEQKLASLAQLRGTPVSVRFAHQYGYILRMHPFRRDGINVRA